MFRSTNPLTRRFTITGNRATPFFIAPLFLIMVALALVSPSSSAHLSPAPPLQANFRVTMNGFHVGHQTRDDALGMDGAFDEIRLMTNTYMISSGGTVSSQRSFKSAVICDGKFADPDGLGTFDPNVDSRRGFKAGDDFPRASPWKLLPEDVDSLGVNTANLPPLTLFEGHLVQGSNAVAIIPTIWEMDGSQELRTKYNDQLSFLESSLGRSIGEILSSARTTDANAPIKPGAAVGLGIMADTIFIRTGFLGLGDPKDRPIGIVKRGDKYVFVPKVLVLTFEAADAIARSNGLAPGVIKVMYEDESDQEGRYELYLQVTRIGN